MSPGTQRAHGLERKQMHKRTGAGSLLATLVVGVAVAGAGCGGSGDSGSSGGASAGPSKVPILAGKDLVTRGPNGEDAAKSSSVELTAAQKEQIRGKKLTAAIVWDADTVFFNSVTNGARRVFRDLGIKVVATTQYNFDLAAQKNQIAAVMSKKPDILLTINDDPQAARQALAPAVRNKTKIVLLSTTVKDWKPGGKFVTTVTGDQAAMGREAARSLAKSIGGKGEVGVLYHDANYFVTNRRDRVLVSTLKKEFPDIKIVDEQGFTTPDQAEKLTSAMLVQHPNIKGMYAAWDAVTVGALSAIRSAGKNDIKVVSMDLGADTAKDMAQGKNVVAITVERTNELGTTMANAAAQASLGDKVPPFLVVPAITVTKDNVLDSWRTVLAAEPPADLTKAAQ